jgi:hypothetical protein
LHPVAWVPLAVLLGLALVTLIWILWPGTRIFPEASLVDEAAILDAQATEAAALRDRRDALRAFGQRVFDSGVESASAEAQRQRVRAEAAELAARDREEP